MKAKDLSTLDLFLKEYPNYAKPGAQAKASAAAAPSKSPTLKPSPSGALAGKAPAQQNQQMPIKDLEPGAHAFDDKGTELEIVGPAGGNSNKPEAIVVKDKKGEFQTFKPEDELEVPMEPQQEDLEDFKKLTRKKSRLHKRVKRLLKSNKVFSAFESLSFEDQLRIISNLDKKKIDEAWSKKYKDSINCSNPKGFSQKAHCDGKKKKKLKNSIHEGAVPVHSTKRDYNDLMKEPLLGSDVQAQMFAYFVVPDPSMIKDFREHIGLAGRDCDLRPIFQRYAKQKLHPKVKDKLDLSESIISEGLSVAEFKKRNNWQVFLDKVGKGEQFFTGTTCDPSTAVQLDPSILTSLSQPDDINQFKVGNQGIILPTKSGEQIKLSSLVKTIDFGGTACKETGVANRGELAEGVLGAATFARIAKRPGAKVTYQEILSILKSLPKSETGGTITKKAKGADAIVDEVNLTVRLGPNTYADLINIEKLTADKLMNSYIHSTVRFVNDYAKLYANYFEKNGVPDVIEIVSDGVSENTDRKTDVYMYYTDMNGERQLQHFDISLKAGTVKQFGQVGYGRSTSPVETRFANVMELMSKFGLNQESFKASPEQHQDDDGIALIKDLYKQAVNLFNAKLGGDKSEYNFLDDLADGVTYFATSNDPKVKLVQLDAGKYFVLDFKKLKPRLQDINLEAQYAETKSGDPVIRFHDANNPKTAGRLLQIRTKSESNGYIRQIIEKEPLLKKLVSVRNVQDIER